jgi:hypothetical protein
MKSYNAYSIGKQQRITTEAQYQAKRRVHDRTRKLILESAAKAPISFPQVVRLYMAVLSVVVLYIAFFRALL